MALSYAHGAISWLAASAAGATYVESGLSFQPQAMRFSICGMASAVDAGSITSHIRRGLGFAASTSDRRCVGTYSGDAATLADTAAIYRADAVAAVVTAAGAVDGLLDLTALASNGFTLTVDDQIAANITVFWEAWGGTDISSAATGEIVEPAATGLVDYAVTGSFQPDVLMVSGCGLVAAAPTAAEASSNWMMGWATGSAATAQSVVAVSSENTPTTMDSDRYHRTGQCLAAHMLSGNSAITARASLSQWNTDGFKLNWLERTTTDRRYIYLAIKGGRWAAGSTTIDGVTLNATATVSGLAFSPVGADLMSHHLAEDADDTQRVSDVEMWGCFSSTTARRSMFIADVNGIGTSQVVLGIDYACVLVGYETVTPSLVAHVDVTSVTSDGFILTAETADASGSATELISYLAFGDAPAFVPAFNLPILQAVNRSHTY